MPIFDFALNAPISCMDTARKLAAEGTYFDRRSAKRLPDSRRSDAHFTPPDARKSTGEAHGFRQ